MKQDGCSLCSSSGGQIVYQHDWYRIVVVDDVYYPGYLRLIVAPHIKELTDLPLSQNLELYQAVLKCEQILRQVFKPTKINLASFGNLTPHLHWHLIPRFASDRHFPNSTWGEITHPNYQPAAELWSLQQNLITDFGTLFLAK